MKRVRLVLVKLRRQCSRSACTRQAVATLTYDYYDSTAVLGPLSVSAEPHAYDLCEHHALNLTVPRGWQVVRLATEFEPAPPTEDDLYALAEAIRQAPSRRPTARTADREAARGTARSLTDDGEDMFRARRAAFQVFEGEGQDYESEEGSVDDIPGEKRR